jgi:hypothetical protein
VIRLHPRSGANRISDMPQLHRLVDYFLLSATVLLTGTALLKLFAALGEQRILDYPDPVLLVHNRRLMGVTAAVECIVGWFIISQASLLLRLTILAWLCSSFWLYQLGRWWFGVKSSCPCLGALFDFLPMTDRMKNGIVLTLLLYLSIGSLLALAGTLWKRIGLRCRRTNR